MNFFPSSRGQASLEFILVLIFMLVIVSAVIVPLGQRAEFALDDVSKIGFSSSGLSLIESTIHTMSSIPGSSRQTIDFYLPKGVSFVCNPDSAASDGNVGLVVPFNRSIFDSTGNVLADCIEYPSSTPAMICTKYFSFPSFSNLHCQGNPTTGYTLDAGQAGFSQSFRITGQYFPGAAVRYVFDFNVV